MGIYSYLNISLTMKAICILLLIALSLNAVAAGKAKKDKSTRNLGVISPSMKKALKDAAKAGVHVIIKCIKDEVKAKTQKLPVNVPVDKFADKIEKFIDGQIDKLRRRRLSIASIVDTMTGGRLSEGAAKAGCGAVMTAMNTDARAALGVPLPGCLSKWFNEKCHDGVVSMFKRNLILRRLASIKKDIMNMYACL